MLPKKKRNKTKITKLGSRKKTTPPARIKAARKKVKKVATRKKKQLSPHAAIMAKLTDICPAIKDAVGDGLESWTLFAHKLLLARRLKTSVNVITVNPQMLEHRELIQKAFPCSIQSPTEARFGMDSISAY